MKRLLLTNIARWVAALGLSVAVATPRAPVLAQADGPKSISIPGSFQAQLGCATDWAPDCDKTALTLDAESGYWIGTFELAAGAYEYKVAVNGTWDVNYGAGGQASGANIGLKLDEAGPVTFLYDAATHWVADGVGAPIVIAVGDFQEELGCKADDRPACLRAWLEDADGDGVFTFTTDAVPAGSYTTTLLVNGAAAKGITVDFTVAADGDATSFSFDLAAGKASVVKGVASAGVPLVKPPDRVVIPGTIQSKLGCSGDWQPECEGTALTLNAVDQVWRGTFDIPLGDYEYKVAINGSWDENYGGLAQRNGPNIPLKLAAPTTVRFYYDHATHWVADSINATIAGVIGDFQEELGCPSDWQADCLLSWLQDPDGDGVYAFTTSALPAGEYQAKVALNESDSDVYGKDGAKNGAGITFKVPKDGQVIYFGYDPAAHELTIGTKGGPKGNLGASRAYWAARDIIAWKIPTPAAGTTFWLHSAPGGGLKLGPDGIEGGEAIPLSYFDSKVPIGIFANAPYLSGYASLKVAAADLARVPDLLKGQVAVSMRDATGQQLDATSMQIAGALDDLYTYTGPLGVTFEGETPTFRLWAPTATSVSLHVYADATTKIGTVVPMTWDAATGVWSVVGKPEWKGRYYLYDVAVYVPRIGQLTHNLVTDPYSLSLSTNSARSQVVDLKDVALQPEGWADVGKPPLEAPEDAVIYELHIRDFSISDVTVPENLRGTYMAFTQSESDGMRHLRALAEAGLTHIHLLPTFDIASVDEDRATWKAVDAAALGALAPDSAGQAASVSELRDSDGFNWGYDPYHYTAPEGSYATDPNGSVRVLEFRSMVAALNQTGLRVIMDVVYNHTTASGQDPHSVLDKIVPGY